MFYTECTLKVFFLCCIQIFTSANGHRTAFVRCAWTDPVVGTSWGHYENMSGRLKNLFFAGESTSQEYYGYVQGAYFTGRDKAEEIR